MTVRSKSLHYDLWPESDWIAWHDATVKGDIFDDGGEAAHWSEGSRRKNLYGYGRWLEHLARTDASTLSLEPAERVTFERVHDYVATLTSQISPAGVFHYVSQLYDTIRVMAPDRDWLWLKELKRRLSQRVKPQSKRHLVVDTTRLVMLGEELMRHAEQTEPHTRPLVRAIQYRDGLMIALLALRPLRRHNFADIRLGQELRRNGESWALVFEAGATKNGCALDFTFPNALDRGLKRYLEVYRPMFKDSDLHVGLWASAKGCPMTPEAIYERITKHTTAAFGRSISPHLFRDCAATTIALRDPKHIGIARDLLGHKDLRTTQRYYNQAGQIEAGRRHQSTLHSIRDRLAEPTNRITKG